MHISIGHLYIFWEISIQILCLFYNCYLFSCYWVTCIPYIFWVLPPIIWMVCKYFFHSIGWGFTLWTIFFAVQKLLVWYNSFCLFFLLWLVPLITYQRNHCQVQLSFCHKFSSKNFVVLALKFRRLIHFQLICIYAIR